ncbi:hypothetical protein D5086_033558 [Populus alba]|uniref:Uncharacterized protein n=1 Tax=Populus alba TaxID=43335 RepID=A0ACC4AH66_POPAL
MDCISAGKKGNYGGVRVVGGSETVRGDGGERRLLVHHGFSIVVISEDHPFLLGANCYHHGRSAEAAWATTRTMYRFKGRKSSYALIRALVYPVFLKLPYTAVILAEHIQHCSRRRLCLNTRRDSLFKHGRGSKFRSDSNWHHAFSPEFYWEESNLGNESKGLSPFRPDLLAFSSYNSTLH